MRVILNESRFDSIFSKWLEKSGIEVKLEWCGVGRLNGYDERIVSGSFTLYEDGELINSYIYSYKYEDGELSFYDMEPNVNRFGFRGSLKIFPYEKVSEYFSDRLKDYILMKLEMKRNESNIK